MNIIHQKFNICTIVLVNDRQCRFDNKGIVKEIAEIIVNNLHKSFLKNFRFPGITVRLVTLLSTAFREVRTPLN